MGALNDNLNKLSIEIVEKIERDIYCIKGIKRNSFNLRGDVKSEKSDSFGGTDYKASCGTTTSCLFVWGISLLRNKPLI